MRVKDISIRKHTAQAIEIPLSNVVLVIILAKKGYLMCGYLNIEAAEKMGDAACVIKGVKNAEELLAGKVSALTSKAMKLGIKPGITGRKALFRLLI